MDLDPQSQRLRDIFREVAERSQGNAKWRFERLSQTFNEVQDAVLASNSMSSKRAVKALEEFHAVRDEIYEASQTDIDVALALKDLSESLQKELQADQAKPSQPAKPPKPPKSGNWNF